MPEDSRQLPSQSKAPFGRCNTCGSDLKTEGQARRQEFDEKTNLRVMNELDSTYAHIRAVVENCKHTTVEAIRHQLVGLLPEVQEMEPELADRLRVSGMGHLVDLQASRVKANWREYGYGDKDDGHAA